MRYAVDYKVDGVWQWFEICDTLDEAMMLCMGRSDTEARIRMLSKDDPYRGSLVN